MINLRPILSALAALPLLAAATTPATSPDDIAPYVSPANATARPASVTYLADGKTYLALADRGTRLVKCDLITGKELETVIDVTTTRDNKVKRIAWYAMSDDGSQILLYEKSTPIYRHSFTAEYYVYEVRHNVLTPLSTEHPRQQAPMFSPDGRMVAFVADNNIYIKKLDYGTEVAVTTDGAANKVINGVPDWVYEEEFSTSVSMTWAPDNLTLCYIKYNETDVPLYSFPLYQGTCDPMDQYELYPGSYTYKYPVAGESNSKVSVHSYDIETRKTKDIQFDDPRIEYIPRISYAHSADRLVVTTLNRAQTRMEMYSVNPKSTVVRSLYVDEVTDGWVDPSAYEQVHYYPQFFVVMSERSGYNHLYQYSYSGSQMSQITSGDFDVTDYYGYDAKLGAHYYQSTATGPINRVVSRKDSKGRVVNLGNEQGNSAATFTPDMSHYMMTYSNVTTPPTYILYASRGDKQVRVLEDNAGYLSRYPKLPQREFFTMTSDGYTLNGSILKPVDFDSSRRYPVIMSQYSGPGSQEVLNRWRMNWDYYYVQKGYIVISVDGRGTGGRGKAFKDCTYLQLGHYETIDQVNAARYAASLPYVDPARIGIYGWSFGGYETLMASSAVDAPYAAAVAVAPVTSWRYYDSIYTERYMLTPRENEQSYRENSPITHVARQNCPLLIMHGTADDNVHLMNTIQYVSALEAAGKTCDMLLFPNMNHSIGGCGARSLVYAKMLDFFNSHLK